MDARRHGEIVVTDLPGDRWLVTLEGDHGLSTADDLREKLRAVFQTGTTVVLDLSNTAFIDSSTLGVLMDADGFAHEHGCDQFGIVVARDSSPDRLFRLAGVHGVFTTFDSVDEAFAHFESPADAGTAERWRQRKRPIVKNDLPEQTRREGGDRARLRQPRVVIDISGWAVVKIVVGLLALAFITDLASQVRDVMVWVLAAAFLAIALNPLVVLLEPKIGRRPAATVVFVGFIFGFLAVFMALVAPFVTQVDQLTTALPNAISDARQQGTIHDLDQRFHLAEKARAHVGDLPGYIFGAADTVLGGAVAASTVFFLTLFLLYELPRLGEIILAQVRPERRPRIRAVADHMNRNIGGYVAGNLVISVICGTVTTLSLYLLDVPYSLALGVFMAVFDLIPLVGATIGSIVVILAALIFQGTGVGIAMFVIVNVYQQIENHILQPAIYGKTVKIPSLTVLLAVLCGGAVLGLIGALLAIPIAATIQAVIAELLEERAERVNAGARADVPTPP
jgi:anti-anti-sigma factor